jgi:hypothetical protein
MEDKKIPRVIRKTDGLYRRQHFNEKVLFTSKEVAEQRLSICKGCSAFEDFGCTVTGFFMPTTVKQKSQQCPYGKWSTNFTGQVE